MKIKNWLKFGRGTRRWLARIICLLIAVVVWLYVMRVAPPMYDEKYRDVRVEVRESDVLPDYTGHVDELLTVRVWGSKEALYTYDAEDITAYVKIADLADTDGTYTPGKTYQLTVYFELPEGLELREDYSVSMLLEGKALPDE